MVTISTSARAVRSQCRSAEDRAAREAPTQELLQRRRDSADEDERRRLLEAVVELNLEIARGIARRFRNKGPDPEDLEQVAYLGLVNAARRYRLDADTPFIGYAIPTIRGEVKRYFRDCAWTVRIPRKLQEMQGLIATKLPDIEQELGREPTRDEIATRLGVGLDDVEQALAARGCFDVLTLDRAALDRAQTLADVLADDADPGIGQLEAIDMLQPVLKDLCARDRRILQLRFVEGWNQVDIGVEIGVSQMQVSRLLRRIFADLRERLVPLTAA
jgi:RNA polymerase sigma-B factor